MLLSHKLQRRPKRRSWGTLSCSVSISSLTRDYSQDSVYTFLASLRLSTRDSDEATAKSWLMRRRRRTASFSMENPPRSATPNPQGHAPPPQLPAKLSESTRSDATARPMPDKRQSRAAGYLTGPSRRLPGQNLQTCGVGTKLRRSACGIGICQAVMR